MIQSDSQAKSINSRWNFTSSHIFSLVTGQIKSNFCNKIYSKVKNYNDFVQLNLEGTIIGSVVNAPKSTFQLSPPNLLLQNICLQNIIKRLAKRHYNYTKQPKDHD